jgi:hypothetical protein
MDDMSHNFLASGSPKSELLYTAISLSFAMFGIHKLSPRSRQLLTQPTTGNSKLRLPLEVIAMILTGWL